MTVVVGKIEPLKKIKEILNENGVTRFNSIGEINEFLKNYKYEREELVKTTKVTFDQELKELEETTKKAIQDSNKKLINKILFYFKIRNLIKRKSNLEHDREDILSFRLMESKDKLDSTKELVDSLYPLIAGAIGENLTVKELEKLSNDYYLINDFSMKFDPPIYNRNEDDKIFSIQIDHLIISKSGLFILETKNWSNQSIKSLDLRSPVRQISRTSYALFVLLNSESNVEIVRHHWGSARIPIRNIIVMTKVKPKEEFKHVKVLTLDQLNGYIQYFDEVFNSDEVKQIFNYLKSEIL